MDEYRGEVAWVYRHFPLDYLHPKADKEAEALECAGELGDDKAFWQLTDKIFAVTPSNNGLDLAELPALAAQVGLDREEFEACLESGRYTDHVEADYQSGLQAGINSTPSSILLDMRTGETKLLVGAYPFTVFKQEIDRMLEQEE